MGFLRSITRKQKKCSEARNKIPPKESSQVTVSTTSSNEDLDDLLVRQTDWSTEGTFKKTLVKKSVQFSGRRVVKLVESYVEHSSDLWWSRDEMEGFKTYQSKGLAGDNKARLYVQSCNMAREESMKLSDVENTVSSSCVSLSNRSYQSIVTGKMDGYAGIEHYCRPIMQEECSDGSMQKVTIPQLIVRTSRSRTDLYGDEDSLRSYARSLSKVDRSWAAVMGRADHDALKKTEMAPLPRPSFIELYL